MVRFGPFELDLRTSWLTRQGHPERLGLQPSRFLTLMVERAGELVTREELRVQLWPVETFVDFDHGLNNAVNRVREVLRDSATSPRYIQTVPRRGYRFIAAVEPIEPPLTTQIEVALLEDKMVEGGESPSMPTTVTPVGPAAGPHTRPPVAAASTRRGLLLLAGSMVLAIAATAVYVSSRKSHPAGPIRSLAVLPMQNLSGQGSEEYFVDGMTDALITELAHTPDLRVVSRTSIMQDKGSKKTLRQIASELNVDAIVEGSVVRSGDRVRITAQLIDVRNDGHLWARSFEEPIGDVLELQDKVVREIASQTQAALAHPPSDRTQPGRVNPAAYDAYLRGLYFLHLRDGAKSVMYFQQAISLDPSYPAAYAGLAQALASDHVLSHTVPAGDTESEAFEAARHAIALDANSGEAYAALGYVEITYHRDWPAAGRDLERGLALDPNNAFALVQYAIYLDAVGRPEDAVAAMRRALALDPLSFIVNRHLGSVLYFARHYQEALFYLHRADEMEPHNFRVVENWRNRAFEMLGQLDQAERADLLVIGGWLPEADLVPLRLAYRQGGWKRYQAAKITLLASKKQLACASFEVGESYLRLGDRDRALSWLSRGIDSSCFWAYSLPVDPELDGLRSDPRFAALLRKAQSPPPAPRVHP